MGEGGVGKVSVDANKKTKKKQTNCNWRHGGGGGGTTCSLVPLEKMALFPKNKILIFFVPCSPKLPVLPCTLYF